jgi:hypothetical protein
MLSLIVFIRKQNIYLTMIYGRGYTIIPKTVEYNYKWWKGSGESAYNAICIYVPLLYLVIY